MGKNDKKWWKDWSCTKVLGKDPGWNTLQHLTTDWACMCLAPSDAVGAPCSKSSGLWCPWHNYSENFRTHPAHHSQGTGCVSPSPAAFPWVHRSVAIHLQHAPPCCSYGRKPTMIPSLQKLKARTARKEINSKPLETDQQTILRPKLSTKPNWPYESNPCTPEFHIKIAGALLVLCWSWCFAGAHGRSSLQYDSRNYFIYIWNRITLPLCLSVSLSLSLSLSPSPSRRFSVRLKASLWPSQNAATNWGINWT